MSDHEPPDRLHDGESHQTDLPRVQVTIPLRETRYHHISVSYSFHLIENKLNLNFNYMSKYVREIDREN